MPDQAPAPFRDPNRFAGLGALLAELMTVPILLACSVWDIADAWNGAFDGQFMPSADLVAAGLVALYLVWRVIGLIWGPVPLRRSPFERSAPLEPLDR